MLAAHGFLRPFLCFLCGVILAGRTLAAADALDVATMGDAPLSLTTHFEVLEDADQSLHLTDLQLPGVAARFRGGQAAADALNFSYTRSAIWLRLRLRNSSAEPLERLLQIAKARLSDVRLYAPAASGGYRSIVTGDLWPFATRPYPNRTFVFPLTLPSGAEQTLYLRIQSESALFIPARLWTPSAFHAYERADYIGQALYFGMAAGMVLFNLLLFVALRDVIYFHYVMFSTAMAYALATQNGLLHEFVRIDSLLFWRLSGLLGFSLALATFLVFLRHMLATRSALPRVDPWLKALVIVHLLVPVVFALSPAGFAKFAQMLFAATLVVIMSVGVVCAFRRQRSAYYFVVAFIVLFAAGLVTSLAGLGVLPANFVTMNALQLGSALEMLLLAFALADRFIVMRREKESAQQLLVANLQRSERLLEESVAQRTAELQASLHDLQATQARLIASEKRALEGQRVAHEALAGQRQFIAMVSHEFRSPLAVIDAAVRLLAVKLDQASGTAPVLARIRRGVARLSGFLDNCLTEDRLDSDGMSLHPEPVDLAVLAAAVRDGAQLGSEQHRIIVELASALVLLRADPQLLRILLLNLLGNAIKYSPPGAEVRLCIGLEDGWCRFDVIDRGAGIAADELPLVWQKYRRGRGAQATPGAGLGLALVARIVELHRGRVEIDSREGEGTRVTVRLPLE